MGVRRLLWRIRRLSRKWKRFVYFIGLLIIMKVFVAHFALPDSDDLRREKIKRAQINDHNKLVEAMLKGEKSLIPLDIHDPEIKRRFIENPNLNEDIILEQRSKQNKYPVPGGNLNVPLIEFDDEIKKLERDFGEVNLPAVTFNPVCEVTIKDSLSAISRAKQNYCKQKIADTACKMQADTLFEKSMPRTCPLDGKLAAEAKIPTSFDESQTRVKICYMLVVHGRSTRQIKRLIKSIYNKRHYYYIHVDRRSQYLYREMLKVSAQYPNIEVAPWRLSTIWGGSSLLQMLLRAMKDVLKLWQDWDFFINLSAMDFPIETEDNLEKFLTTHRDKNFMKSHGRNDDKFIRKQGLNKVFLECEQHMWRLGERKIPEGLTLNGGSDWLALNRQLCNLAVHGDSPLVNKLKYWFEYTLLPAESFFHTLVQNSELCGTFVDNNLRVTNWNRARGCKCQYKHIVDWCGCSPNDFFPSDLSRLQTSRPVFFARKFEEVVNQEVINHLDFKLYGKYPLGTRGIDIYWENCYEDVDGVKSAGDEFITHYMSFARIGLAALNPPSVEDVDNPVNNNQEFCRLHFKKLKQIDIYKHKEEFRGYLATYKAAYQSPSNRGSLPSEKTITIQSLLRKTTNIKILDYSSMMASRLQWALVGTQWDVKELLLRDWGGIIGPQSRPRLVMKWAEGKDDFILTVVLVDPLNVIAEYTDFRTPTRSAGVTETVMNLEKPIRPGKWTIRFYIQRNFQKIAAEMNFFVTPLQFKDGVVDADELAGDNRGVVNDDHLNSLDRNLYSIRTTLNLKKDEGAESSLAERSLYDGEDLEAWIDEVIGGGWQATETCLVADTMEDWHDLQSKNTCKSYTKGPPVLCKDTAWSSFAPDPKSELGAVKSNGRIR